MSEENPFLNDLDNLIHLFRKFREKTLEEDIPGFDKHFFQSFDMIVNNYEKIKHQIPKDYLQQINEPMRKMIKSMISQLQDELGEDIEQRPEIKKTVNEIDELLKNPNLSASEIDNLLDKRTSLNKSSDDPTNEIS